MTWSVYQHWDPLRVCVVGRSYPPEFYNWIQNIKIRSLFEKIAEETEEDLLHLINLLEKFNIEVLRPDLLTENFIDGKFLKPPLSPRDYLGMIGTNLYYTNKLFMSKNFSNIYNDIKDSTWPNCDNIKEFKNLPQEIQQECIEIHDLKTHLKPHILTVSNITSYSSIIDRVLEQNNSIKRNVFKNVKNDVANRAMIFPLGRDLFFGTTSLDQNQGNLLNIINQEFRNTRNHIVNSGGHLDGSIFPITPGLIFTTPEINLSESFFKDWEILSVAQYPTIEKFKQFKNLKTKNHGKWWIPGCENDQSVIDLVELYFSGWLGQVSETIFDINVLMIDPKNVIVSNHNDLIEKACARYGIEVHVVPFRHRYFWDSGIHCLTSDLNREGSMQDYFLERNYVQ